MTAISRSEKAREMISELDGVRSFLVTATATQTRMLPKSVPSMTRPQSRQMITEVKVDFSGAFSWRSMEELEGDVELMMADEVVESFVRFCGVCV